MKQTSSTVKYFIPRMQDLLLILIFYFVLLIGTGLFRDGDPGRHITMGLYILKNRTIPIHDIFSYTMLGQPLTPHEWLAQLVYGAAYSLFNLNGVVLVAALIIACTITLVYCEILHRNISSLVAFFLSLWAASMMSIHWLARPHIFTWIILAIWSPLCLRLVKGEPVRLWVFPIIMLLWANLHGAFIAGFVVWIACTLGWIIEAWENKIKPSQTILRNLLITGGTSFVVTFINPVGWRLWSTSMGYITNRYLVDLTSEYHSPNFHDPASWPFLLFILLAILLFSQIRKKFIAAEVLLLVGWLILGLISSRNIPLFAIISMPILAGHIQFILEKIQILKKLTHNIDRIDQQLHGAFWSTAAIIFLSIQVVTGHPMDAAKQGYHFNHIEFPVDAVNWLEVHPQSGNMFNYFPWGGYLIYRLWPDDYIFIDGQLDFYGERLTRQHQEILDADPGWEEIVLQYNIRWMIIPVEEPIARVLSIQPGWEILYRDDTALIARKQ